MFTAILVIMILLSLCWIIGITCLICKREDYATTWFAGPGGIAFIAIWFIFLLMALDPKDIKKTPEAIDSAVPAKSIGVKD